MSTAKINFLKPEVLASISSLELRARAVVEGFLSGLHRSPFKGFSVEFAEYRQYTPGDDPRGIDWKVYGRTDKYYVKEFEEETNLNCYFLLDLSNSMTYASGAVSKLTYATWLIASLGYLMLRQRDSSGLITFTDKIETHIPAALKTSHLYTMFAALEKAQPGARTDLGNPLHQVADSLGSKGLLILISDCLDKPEKLLDALQHFRFRGHDVILFHVMDDAELTFPFYNSTRFVGLEGEGTFAAVPKDVKQGYLERLNKHMAEIRAGCGLQRVDYKLLNTSTPLDFALQAYLAARAGKM